MGYVEERGKGGGEEGKTKARKRAPAREATSAGNTAGSKMTMSGGAALSSSGREQSGAQNKAEGDDEREAGRWMGCTARVATNGNSEGTWWRPQDYSPGVSNRPKLPQNHARATALAHSFAPREKRRGFLRQSKRTHHLAHVVLPATRRAGALADNPAAPLPVADAPNNAARPTSSERRAAPGVF